MSTTDSRGPEFREGALACLEAMRKMERAAKASTTNYDETMQENMDTQFNNAQELVSAFGPMTPRQEGAMLTLAEWIHEYFTCGEMDLSEGCWKPVIAMTEADRQQQIERALEDQAADDEMVAKLERERMSNVIQFPCVEQRPTA